MMFLGPGTGSPSGLKKAVVQSTAFESRSLPEGTFNAQHLVPLYHAFTAGEGTHLELTRIRGNGEVADKRIFGFT